VPACLRNVTWGAQRRVAAEAKNHISISIDDNLLLGEHASFGRHYFASQLVRRKTPQLLFTENETNSKRVFNSENGTTVRQGCVP